MNHANNNLKSYEERIIRDIGICGGEPVFKGTRITLRTVLAGLAGGEPFRIAGLIVAVFRFSRRAEADLLSTGDYTLRTWGKAQAVRYLADLEVFCHTLAANPALGRPCDEVRPGLRRMRMANT
jgi:hypothetical protein